MSVDYKARIIYADVIDKVTKTEEAWKDVCRLAGQIYRYEFDNVLMYMPRSRLQHWWQTMIRGKR